MDTSKPEDMPPEDPAVLQASLLSWYDRHRRRLPWRAPPGRRADPYAVWLSEVMLQQTTVPAAAGYFQRFLERWPTVESLARAPLDDVLAAWAGLGYYARARNLHRCAIAVVEGHGGHFPEDAEGLRQLPGIGAYTAEAIAAIAFDRPAVVVDGNVERVVARLFAVEEPLPGAKPRLRRLAGLLAPEVRPGDHAQAMMDLGATVCTPRRPRCVLCPWRNPCRARARGLAEALPARAAKAPRPVRSAVAFWLLDGAGRVLLRRRPETGLLGGMMEIPSSAWTPGPTPPPLAAAAAEAPVAAPWRLLPGGIRHVFTHFELHLAVAAGAIPNGPPPPGCRWAAIDTLGEEALPSVMRKVVRHALRQ